MKSKHDIIWLESVDSTNHEAARQISNLDNLSVVSAVRQTEGRGQRGNKWLSNDGENLLFSIVLKLTPPMLAYDQFVLNELTSLAVVDFLASYGISADIKWPNDIYVDDRKICGILIENSLRDSHISSSIVGIGLNVNQRNFDDSIKNPTSIVLCNDTHGDRNYDLKQCLTEFMDIFKSYANRYLHMNGGYRSLRRLYLARLWRKDQLSGFIDFTTLPSGHLDGPMEIYSTDLKHPAGREFKGIIRGLSDIGNLLVEDQTSGTVREFGFKEIGYLL